MGTKACTHREKEKNKTERMWEVYLIST
jgi:hypothetical protein